MAFIIKRNDRYPRIRRRLLTGNVPVDLTLALSVQFIMRAKADNTVKINAAADIIDAVTGEVEYDWQGADDTDTAGDYEAEFEVKWGDGTQTFPSDEYIAITVKEDIGDAP